MKKRREQLTYMGVPLVIEWRKGDVRSGVDGTGKKWERKMHAHYGRIPNTKGLDGEPLDFYLGDHPTRKVFRVSQMKAPDFKKIDEHKYMLGYEDRISAVRAYLKHYPSKKFMGKVDTMSIESVRRKLREKVAQDEALRLELDHLYAITGGDLSKLASLTDEELEKLAFISAVGTGLRALNSGMVRATNRMRQWGRRPPAPKQGTPGTTPSPATNPTPAATPPPEPVQHKPGQVLPARKTTPTPDPETPAPAPKQRLSESEFREQNAAKRKAKQEAEAAQRKAKQEAAAADQAAKPDASETTTPSSTPVEGSNPSRSRIFSAGNIAKGALVSGGALTLYGGYKGIDAAHRFATDPIQNTPMVDPRHPSYRAGYN